MKQSLLNRLLRYTQIHTTSDRKAKLCQARNSSGICFIC
ncbi:Uncharacterised protein [Mannheimia haemolytica]|uniref:Uncharacterized protein n=1 Tax=Mannheimia haemolytica TaxID=75985 RepID=A0A378MWD0_MANHA|nr:Uncharacterised protein [Mannheimia haemolytica]